MNAWWNRAAPGELGVPPGAARDRGGRGRRLRPLRHSGSQEKPLTRASERDAVPLGQDVHGIHGAGHGVRTFRHGGQFATAPRPQRTHRTYRTHPRGDIDRPEIVPDDRRRIDRKHLATTTAGVVTTTSLPTMCASGCFPANYRNNSAAMPDTITPARPRPSHCSGRVLVMHPENAPALNDPAAFPPDRSRHRSTGATSTTGPTSTTGGTPTMGATASINARTAAGSGRSR